MLPGWACERWRWTHGVRCDWGWRSLQAGQRLATYFFLPLNRHGVLQNSCCAVLLLVPCIRSAKQLLSRTAASSAPGALLPPWSQPSSQLRGRSGRQSDFARGLFAFSLLQTPARENQLSAFDPYRYPVRRNAAFPLMIAFADKKGEMCCVSAVEEPDASRATGIRVGSDTANIRQGQLVCAGHWAWSSSSSQSYASEKWTFHFSPITSPEGGIMSASTARQQTFKFSQPFNRHGQASGPFAWSFD